MTDNTIPTYNHDLMLQLLLEGQGVRVLPPYNIAPGNLQTERRINGLSHALTWSTTTDRAANCPRTAENAYNVLLAALPTPPYDRSERRYLRPSETVYYLEVHEGGQAGILIVPSALVLALSYVMYILGDVAREKLPTRVVELLPANTKPSKEEEAPMATVRDRSENESGPVQGPQEKPTTVQRMKAHLKEGLKRAPVELALEKAQELAVKQLLKGFKGSRAEKAVVRRFLVAFFSTPWGQVVLGATGAGVLPPIAAWMGKRGRVVDSLAEEMGDRTATLIAKEGGKLGLKAVQPILGGIMGLFESMEAAQNGDGSLLSMLAAPQEKLDLGAAPLAEPVPVKRAERTS